MKKFAAIAILLLSFDGTAILIDPDGDLYPNEVEQLVVGWLGFPEYLDQIEQQIDSSANDESDSSANRE